MHQKIIYVLHKNGANSHYNALNFLLQQNSIKLKYREFSLFSSLFKGLISFNFVSLKKQCVNLGFLITLLVTKNKKIVLGIAPFDSKLKRLLFLLKNHNIYYHTSWTYWDKSFHPKYKKNSTRVYESWRFFLEEKVKHIFAVTQQSKNQLLDNYKINDLDISVVYHALHQSFIKTTQKKKKELSFIYLGRLLPQKGLKELLTFFANRKVATFTIVGDGKEKTMIEDYANKNTNIIYIPYIKDTIEIVNLLALQQYLILNSKKTKKWEELFGLVIIESMSQGVIPVATNHSGPKEIITKDVGYLCNEGEITKILNKLILGDKFDERMSKNAVKAAKFYLEESIAQKWSKILN